MTNSKQKGAGGEREACITLGKMLCDRMGVLPTGSRAPYTDILTRNLEQTRDGGADIMGIDGLCIEVKRCETVTVPMWWRQVVRAADNTGRTPVLMYRQNRKPWTFCLPSALLVIGATGYLTLGEPDFRVWLRHWVS